MTNAAAVVKKAVIAITVIWSGIAFADESVLSYRGDAFSLDGGKLLYTEHHQLTFKQIRTDSDQIVNEPISRITRYQDANTEEFAVKENTYLHGSATPEFNLTDTRYGYYEEVTYENDRWRASYREPTESDKGKLGKPDYTPVIDSGFDEFVRSAWPKLMDGKTVRFSFAVPSRLEWVNFRLIPVKNKSGVLTVEMRLSSKLLSWLLTPVQLSYDTNTMRLLTYRGLTNIRNENGEGIQAEIRYTYPD